MDEVTVRLSPQAQAQIDAAGGPRVGPLERHIVTQDAALRALAERFGDRLRILPPEIDDWSVTGPTVDGDTVTMTATASPPRFFLDGVELVRPS